MTRKIRKDRKDLLERLSDKFLVGDGCWEWTAAKLPLGYGFLNHDGKRLSAHRVVYELLVGPIPENLPHLDHLCRNPSCVKPSHLEPVTARVNILRGMGWAARNAAKTCCPQDHEYTEENTAWVSRPGRVPFRVCRTCRNARLRAAYYKRKARAAEIASQ